MEESTKSNCVEAEFSEQAGVYISHVLVPVHVNSNVFVGYDDHSHSQRSFNTDY